MGIAHGGAVTLLLLACVAGDLAPPLRLTPLLEAGNATGARLEASVEPLVGLCCRSYAGFLTVDAQYDANLFFWYFPAQSDPWPGPPGSRQDAPLVVWLQGGPGTSLMRPVLLENGAYSLDPRSGALDRRTRGAWTRMHSVLYFDNPVGTGYSFVGDVAGMASTAEQVSAALSEALRQFLIMFPEQRHRPLYIAGESYGGKMATSLAHRLLLTSGSGLDPPRPSGLIIINALVEAESQLDKSDLAFQLGLVDETGRDEMRALAEEQLRLVREGRWTEALLLSRDECGSDISPRDTGLVSLSNLLLWNGTQDDGFEDLAQREDIRAALHVGDLQYNARSSLVALALREDTGVSVLPLLGEVADHIRVLVVNGQLDLCMPYRLTANVLAKMKWRGAAGFASSPRVTWCEDGQLAGYARSADNLAHVLVRNAGHYLGQDQPRWSEDLLRRFTAGRPFSCEPTWTRHRPWSPQTPQVEP